MTDSVRKREIRILSAEQATAIRLAKAHTANARTDEAQAQMDKVLRLHARIRILKEAI